MRQKRGEDKREGKTKKRREKYLFLELLDLDLLGLGLGKTSTPALPRFKIPPPPPPPAVPIAALMSLGASKKNLWPVGHSYMLMFKNKKTKKRREERGQLDHSSLGYSYP